MSTSPHAAGRIPLRVCMVHFSDFHIDSRIQRQAAVITEHGGEVDCICLSPDGALRDGDGVVRLHQVPMTKSRGGARAYVGGYARFLAGAAARLTDLHRRRPFDVVEIDNMPNALVFAGLLPKLRGVPIVLDVHDTFPELFETTISSNAAASRLVRAEEWVSAKFADAMFVVTEEARLRLEARGVGRGKTHVCMNTPDEAVFGARREPRADWAPGAPVRAVYHGGLAPRFGPDVLVEAFAGLRDELPGVSIDVYGADADRERVAALAAERSPQNVRVAPEAVPYQEIPDRLAQAQLGIVPTLRDDFTELLLPVKLLEYVHMGLPVITSRLPVIERYFTAGEVAFFEPGDAASLEDAIRRTLADPEAARRRAVAAGERLDAMAWSRGRGQYLAVLEGLAASARHRRAPSAAAA